MDLKRLHRLYDEYVDGFRVDGKLSPMTVISSLDCQQSLPIACKRENISRN